LHLCGRTSPRGCRGWSREKLLLRILAGMLVFIAGRVFFEHGDGSGNAVTKP
jgi:hypothetical protein